MAEQFPTSISYGSGGGPTFATEVMVRRDGAERRNANRSTALWVYNVAPGIRSQTYLDSLRACFFAHQGRLTPFRYKDWLDYELCDEEIGRGDGATAAFQVAKRYHGYARTIRRLVSGTLVVKVAGVTKTETTHYTADYDAGVVTFTDGNEPEAGAAVAVTCEFDVYCRFDADELPSTYEQWQVANTDAIAVVEVLE